MERRLLSDLISWKDSPHRKPLLLRGPRQVGKTWLLKEFAARYFGDVAYFNFDEDPSLATLFDTTKDVDRILEQLSVLNGAPIRPGETLLVLDEIQECNAALGALKYFCENAPGLHVAGAGSLLGVTLSRPGSFPVGKVDFLDLTPMSFTEFLLASGETSLAQFLDSVAELSPLPDMIAETLTEKLVRYLIIGGMPEPVSLWSTEQDLRAVMSAQQAILDAYQLDFAKHAPAGDIARIGYLWRSVPSQLARDNRKFLYAAARQGARARGYEDALNWLASTGVVTRVFRCTAPRLPLSGYDDLSSFKLYMADTGLLARHSKLDPTIAGHRAAPFTEFKGALTENFVLQSLRSHFEVEPRSWASEGQAEVEFILQRGNSIHPVEVKSGISVRSKSLGVYRKRYDPALSVRFSLRNLQFRDGLLDVPLYMVDQLDRLLRLAEQQ